MMTVRADHLCSKDSSFRGKIREGVFGHTGRIMDLCEFDDNLGELDERGCK